MEPPLNAPGAQAEGSPDSLCPCSVTSAAAVLSHSRGFHRAGACPDLWRSLYLQLAVSLGRVLLQNLILFDLIEKLQEADETSRCSSGQVVTAPLLELVVIY